MIKTHHSEVSTLNTFIISQKDKKKCDRYVWNLLCNCTKRKRGFVSTSSTKISPILCKYRAEQTLNDAEFIVWLVEERSKQASVFILHVSGAQRVWRVRRDAGRTHVACSLLLPSCAYHKDVLVATLPVSCLLPPALDTHLNLYAHYRWVAVSTDQRYITATQAQLFCQHF